MEVSAPVEKVSSYRIDLTRLMSTLYFDLEQQIARADAKANLILAANSILIAGSINMTVSYVRSIGGLQHVLLLAGFLAPAVILSALAVHYALTVAYPRQHVAARVPGYPGVGGELYSSFRIASRPLHEFVDEFLDSSLDDIKRQVLLGIHAKATVLQTKFRYVRYGIWSTVGAFVFWLGFVSVMTMGA